MVRRRIKIERVLLAVVFLGLIFTARASALTETELNACLDGGGIIDLFTGECVYKEKTHQITDPIDSNDAGDNNGDSSNSSQEQSTKSKKTKTNTTYTTERTGTECMEKGGVPVGGFEGNVQCSFSKTVTVTTTVQYSYGLAKSECEAAGGIFVRYNDDETVVCQFVYETTTDSAGGNSDYQSQYNTGDWSRPSHPGRDPAGAGSFDPGSSDVSESEPLPAIQGNGYSSTGGVQQKEENVSTSILSCADGANGEGIFCILNNAIVVLTAGVGIAGTLGIVLSGIQYATARDSVEQMTKARRRIINIIIGLVVYAVAWGFLNWLIPGGLF